MEYTAVRYPTKEYRQYRPGSKGLNVHYRAFREQFYGNKAIIKRSFRDIHRNPSVGQYTDQRGIPTYAYKIPNGKMYKTAPLMDRIPRGGSVPRVVGSLGDVQGPEFFTEGTYQPPAAAGQTLNSPFLFGKASQELQDATAQYQAQTGKPVNAAVIKSKEFTDFYSAFIQNSLAKESQDSYLQRFQNDFQKPNEIAKVVDELTLVNPAINTDQSTQPAPDAVDTPMGNTTESEGFLTQTVGHISNFLFNTRLPNNLTGEQPVDKNTAQSTTSDSQNVNDAGNYKNMPVDRISGANQNAMISTPGPLQVDKPNFTNAAESAQANQAMDPNTEQDIRDPKDKASTVKARKLSIDKMNKTTLEGKSEIDGLGVPELKKKLTEKGLDFKKNATKKDLAKLLHQWYMQHEDYKEIRPKELKLKKAKKEEEEVDEEKTFIPQRRASQPDAESSTMVKRKSEDDLFFDAKSRRSSNSSNSSSSSEEDIAAIKELQQDLKNTSDADLQRIFKQYDSDKNTTPQEKEDEIEKKSLIRKIVKGGGTVLLLGGSFYGLNRAQEMNDKYGEEYLGQLGSMIVTGSIRYFQKWLRDKYGLLANAGAVGNRLVRGETLQQAVTNEAFIATVHHYFENYALLNEAVRTALPFAGRVIGGLAGSMVGFPTIGGTLGTVGGSSLSYTLTRAFFETIQEDIDVSNLIGTAERVRFRLGQVVSSAATVGLIAASSTAGYILPNTEELTDFLTQLFNSYLAFEKRVLEK